MNRMGGWGWSAMLLTAALTGPVSVPPVQAAGQTANIAAPITAPRAIENIAAALRAMGRGDVATRLIDDVRNRRVVIGTVGGNAETAPPIIVPLVTGRANNIMTLDRTLEIQCNTYETDRNPVTHSTLSWALTVIHEYVHMNQDNPVREPAFENPAWRAAIEENQRWIRGVMDQITDAELHLPNGRAKIDRLTELMHTLDDLRAVHNGTVNDLLQEIRETHVGNGLDWPTVDLGSTRDLDQVQATCNSRVDAFNKNTRDGIARFERELRNASRTPAPTTTPPGTRPNTPPASPPAVTPSPSPAPAAPPPPPAGGTFTAEKGTAPDAWSHIRVTVGNVTNFKTEDRPGWRNNGTGFSAVSAGDGRVPIQVTLAGNGGVSYFDYTSNVSIRTSDGKVLVAGQPVISKDGGNKSYTAEWDAVASPGGVTVDVKITGGNPEFFTYFVTGTIRAGQPPAGPPPPSAPRTPGTNTAPPAATPDPGTLSATISLASGSARVVLGQALSFRAAVSSTNSTAPIGALVYRWQPNSEARFSPAEGASPQASTVFTRLGRVKVWVDVLRQTGAALSTAAESNQLDVEVIAPTITLGATPAQPYPGQEVRIAATITPAASADYLDLSWGHTGAATSPGPLPGMRGFTFAPKDTSPVVVTVHARARDGGEDAGSKAITIIATALAPVGTAPPPPAGAPPVPPPPADRQQMALRLRTDAKALQDQGRFREAAAKYRESLTYVPDPALEDYIKQVEAVAARQDAAAAAVTGAPPAPEGRAGVRATETVLLSLMSIAGVSNNPPIKTVFTLTGQGHITKILTYHWNGGRGSAPGTISLRNALTGQIVGTWRAVSSKDGYDLTPGAAWSTSSTVPPSLYWTVQPDIDLPAGTYEVVDSDPATWSFTSDTGNRGITYVFGWKSTAGLDEIIRRLESL